MKPTLKELIKNGYCEFSFLRAGFAYFILTSIINEDLTLKYSFSIPLDDIANSTLSNKERAITLMRWIRKAMENNELIIVSQEKAKSANY